VIRSEQHVVLTVSVDVTHVTWQMCCDAKC